METRLPWSSTCAHARPKGQTLQTPMHKRNVVDLPVSIVAISIHHFSGDLYCIASGGTFYVRVKMELCMLRDHFGDVHRCTP